MPATVITERALIAAALAPLKRWRAAAVAASVGVAIAVVAQAVAIALAVDMALSRGEPPAFDILVLALSAIALRFAMLALRDACSRRAARAMRAELRERLRGRIDALGPLGVAHEASAAAWVGRYQVDVDALSAWPSRYLPAHDAVFIVPPVVLLMAAMQDAFSAVLLALAAPLILAFMVLTGLGSERVQARQQHEQHRMGAHFLDRLRALDLIRRSGALAHCAREVFAAAERYRMLSMRVLRIAFLSSAVMELFSAISIGLVAIHVGFALLGSTSAAGEPGMTLFAGLFVLLLAPEYFLPLRAFAQTWHDRAGALAAAKTLGGVLAGDRSSAPGLPRAPQDAALLDARGLSLAPAPDAPPVVVDANLRVLPGQIVVITGPSGAGKTTLLAACAGFSAALSGTLTRVADIAWLGQGGHLFHGTLRDNLRLVANDADDARLQQAMALAGLPADDPALPDGLDTRIDEGRRGLSGGQAQRVALARAWLSGARLWLLDEPTRGLDDETAEALWLRLVELARRRGAGLLVATHDPRAVAHADRVLRLTDGCLQEVSDAFP